MWTHVSNYLFYPHPRENASVIFRKPNAPRPAGAPPPPGCRMTADPAVSQPPRRGRRPRRLAAAASAGLAAFRRPPPGRGMLSRHITRRTALPAAATRRGRRPRRPFPSSTASPTTFLQPLVGAGFHPRPACVYHRHCGVARAAGGLGRPQRGNPRRGFPL